MTFPMPTLDERTFQDIVDEAKKRIPLHAPEWTDHNVSDPGVALIELFAWMTESLMYQLNVVPDRLYRSFLELFGVAPYSPQAASTPVTFWVSPNDGGEHEVPIGTSVATARADDGSAVEFTTTQTVTIRQPELKGVLSSHASRSTHAGADIETLFRDESDARQEAWPDNGGAPVDVFSNELVPGDAMYFGFEKSEAANVLRVDVDAVIKGIGVNPDSAPLVWEVSVGNKQWVPCELDPNSDTTAGLNRSGHVRLYLPFEHVEELYGDVRAYWLRVRLTDGQPEYERSPAIERVSFRSEGVRAPAEQGVPAGSEHLGISNGKPGQSFCVSRSPVLKRAAGETIQVLHRGTVEDWTEVDTFAESTKSNKHFTWDSASGAISFGPTVMQKNGEVIQHGAIPEDGAEIMVAGYRHGGGTSGNVGEDRIIVARSSLPFIQRVNNRTAATGGVDAETIENAKIRGPMTLASHDRAVTAADFESVTLTRHPEIARAHCEAVADAGQPVRLFVVKRTDKAGIDLGAADLTPDRNLLLELKQTLDERRMLGVALAVSPAALRSVSIMARVVAKDGNPTASVKEVCEKALYDYIHPLTGGVTGDGWAWSHRLTATEVGAVLKGVPGVRNVLEVIFFDVEDTPGDPDGKPQRVGTGNSEFELPVGGLPLSTIHQVLVDKPPRPSRAVASTGSVQ